MLRKPQVYEKILQSGNLPTLPEILVRLLDACESETASLPDIAALISKDPVLSFKVLQLVNSTYYGLPKRFSGIEPAVVYLGANCIKNLAMATSIHQVFERGRLKQVKRFSLSGFWWHSLLCATMSRRLAVKSGFSNHDEAYLAGLLHDIGRLALLAGFPREHQLILLETEDPSNVLWAETQLIGIDHSEAGAWLIGQWHLNSLVGDAIRYHHESPERIADSFPLIKIIYLANLLAQEDYDQRAVEAAGEPLLNLGAEVIREVAGGAAEEVASIAAGLGVRARRTDRHLRAGTAKLPVPVSTEPMTGGWPPNTDPPTDQDQAEQELVSRVKSVTLLSGFLEDLVRVGGTGAVVESYEHCMKVLFDINRVLFFLLDQDGALLSGCASAGNPLRAVSQDLVIPAQRSSSMIVKALNEQSSIYVSDADLSDAEKEVNLVDRQLLSVLHCKTALLVPIVAAAQGLGVVLLGLPDGARAVSEADSRLLRVITRQAGLSLSMERFKAKKAEEIETERLEAISMTARTFAHEVNNPLGIISNYLASLKLKLPEGVEMRDELAIIDEEIQRISAMINRLNLFSRTSFNDLAAIDLNGVVADIVCLVKSSLLTDSGTSISFLPDPALPRIHTSPGAIKQILLNLLKNSVEALAGDGVIEVQTRAIPASASGGGEKAAELTVSDTGPGLPESVRGSLFQPFITTKETDHPGLGLSIVYKAVKDLGGTISCTGGPASGTSFSIRFPSLPLYATVEKQ